MNLAELSPETFQSAALGWLAVLVTLVPALGAVALLILRQINTIKAQVDTHDDRIHALALASPPPGSGGPLIVASPAPAQPLAKGPISPVILALLLPALALSLTSCGTPFGIGLANAVQSPVNQAIVNAGVQVGVASLVGSLGGSASPEVTQPLATAASAVAENVTWDLIFAGAQALRTKQTTPSAALPGALTAALMNQAALPQPTAAVIAQQVAALHNQGIPPSVANEAIASALDGVATAKAPPPSAGKAVVPAGTSRREVLPQFRTSFPTLTDFPTRKRKDVMPHALVPQTTDPAEPVVSPYGYTTSLVEPRQGSTPRRGAFVAAEAQIITHLP